MSDLTNALQAIKLLSQLSEADRSAVFAHFQDMPAAPQKPPAPAVRPEMPRPASVIKPKPEHEETLEFIVQLLQNHPEGMRSEQIQQALEMDKASVTPALIMGLDKGVLTKEGERRATTYLLPKSSSAMHEGRVIRRTK